MRYWISWHQDTEDCRPLVFPPPGVMGWWYSGYDGNEVPILVALVDAKSEEAAHRLILKYWPEARSWRFVEERADDWRPGDRFPLPDWSPLATTAAP